MHAPRFAPIDLERHFDRCVQFLSDAFVCSYGSTEQLDAMGGPEAYRQGLEHSLATFPAGCVHVWLGDDIVGQVEMRLRQDLDRGVVNLFYLVPEQRGGSLGGELHSYAVRVFSGCGVSALRLSVSPSNQRAVRFYAKHGWRDLGPRPDRPYVRAMEYRLDRFVETDVDGAGGDGVSK